MPEDTFLEHLDQYLIRKEDGKISSIGSSSDNSWNRDNRTTIHNHYHNDSWLWGQSYWYHPYGYSPWGSWWGSPRVNHYHYNYDYGSSERKNKKRDAGDKIMIGMIFGGVLLGIFYYFAGKFIDYREENAF